jgi:hypothetical protein
MRSIERALRPARSTLAIVGLVAAVYLLNAYLSESRGFWVVDNAIRFVQTQGILDSHYTDYSLPWAGAKLDPAMEYQPMVFPFFAVQDGKLFASYSPVFPALTAPLYAAFGFAGLYVLPLTFSVLMLVGLVKLAGIAGLGGGTSKLAVLLAGLCTPIWFYSFLFWEHNIAVCLCVWAVYLHLRFAREARAAHLVVGSLLAASSVYFRDELYLFCALLATLALFTARERRGRTALLVAASMTLGVLPLWLFQWKTIGRPFGFHLGVHAFSFPGLTEHLADRWEVVYRLLIRSSPEAGWSLVLAAPFVISFLVSPKLPRATFARAVPVFCVAALASFFFVMRGYFISPSPIYWMGHANSLFAVSPILILAFVRRGDAERNDREPAATTYLRRLCLAYVALYVLLSPLDATEGIHWGNRLLLVLYPFFAILAASGIGRWRACAAPGLRWQTGVVAVTVLVSLGAQLYSVTLAHEKKAFTRRVNETIQARPEETIITDVWWVPWELFSQFSERPIFGVRSAAQLRQLVALLHEAGHEESVLVTPTSHMQAAPAVAVVQDDALGFFSLKLVRVRTRP